MKRFCQLLTMLIGSALFCCDNPNNSQPPGSYSADASFLRKHVTNVIELSSASGTAKVLLSADYQGRVMFIAGKHEYFPIPTQEILK
jgi:hypothetical protein